MRVTIHQPDHAPWPGFFHKVSRADTLVLLDQVPFRKNYFGNRNRLLGPGGPFWVTVPIHYHLGCTYREIGIARDGRWARRYLRSLQQHYGRHPFFGEVYPALESALSAEHGRLLTLNLELLKFMLDYLGIRTELVLASSLQAKGSRSELLLELCRRLGASTYLSGPLGRNYLREEIFGEAGIQVEYDRFEPSAYPQRGHADFTPGLSALDLMMNCGRGGRQVIGS